MLMAMLTTSAELVEGRVVRLEPSHQPAAERGLRKGAFLGNRAGGQEADIHGRQDGACDHDLLRDEFRKTDIAGERRQDGQRRQGQTAA